MADEYVFIDEWDVEAPQEPVFDALADARTYPEWWRPVYIAVEADYGPEVGCVSRQQFKGRLPYHLKTRSEIVRLERPREFEVSVVGDLTGKGSWTLTPSDGGVHVRFDWRVVTDRPLLRSFASAASPPPGGEPGPPRCPAPSQGRAVRRFRGPASPSARG